MVSYFQAIWSTQVGVAVLNVSSYFASLFVFFSDNPTGLLYLTAVDFLFFSDNSTGLTVDLLQGTALNAAVLSFMRRTQTRWRRLYRE